MDLRPIGVLPTKNSQNEQKQQDTDWNLCVICQSDDEDIRSGNEKGFKRFIESYRLRMKYRDLSYQQLIDRIGDNVSDLQLHNLKWHKDCYSTFTSKAHIKRLEKQCDEPIDIECANITEYDLPEVKESNKEHILRSTSEVMNKELCLLCQKRKRTLGKTEERLILVQTKNVSNIIEEIAKKDGIVGSRLAALEPIVAKIKYHQSCLSLRKYEIDKNKHPEDSKKSICDVAFEQILQKIDIGFVSGNIYTLASLQEVYNSILIELGLENANFSSQLLLKRLTEHYGDTLDTVLPWHKNESTLIFPRTSTATAIQALGRASREEESQDPFITLENIEDQDQALTRMIFHVGQKVKNDLKETKGLENIGEIDTIAAERIVPESLKLLLTLILTKDESNADDVHNKVLSIGQDMVYAYDGKKLTPKHLGIGLAVHQATRSAKLIKLLHAAGNCVAYDTLRRIDTSLALHVLKQYEENNKVFIPETLQPNKFVHFATDNIDFLEETLDGKGTFHATQIVAFQRGPAKKMNDIIPLGRTKTLHNIPSQIFEVAPTCAIKNPPIQIPPNTDCEKLCERETKTVLHSRDVAWLLCRSENASGKTVPSWTEMNKLVCDKSHKLTTVGYIPILPHPAHEIDTLITVLQKCRDITRALGQKYTVLTCDEALYCKIKQIKWHDNMFDDVVVRLGGFHWVLNFLRIIGQHFNNSGLQDVWTETGVYGENTARNIMEGRHYNRSIRALKLTCDALWRVLFRKLKKWASENDKYTDEVLSLVESFTSELCADVLKTKWDIIENKTNDVMRILNEFDEHNASNQLYKFWRTYLNLAGLVLKFIRGEREGNWELHLEAVSQMLPWFYTYDRTNYARWGTMYLADMIGLSQSVPEVYKEFMRGNFVVKTTKKSFNEKSPDQALEHINRIHKVASGLVGITRLETARDRWCLTFNYRSYLSEKSSQLFGIEHEDSYDDNSSGAACSEKDERDVKKLEEMFSKLNVFDERNSKLVNIFSGEVASEEISIDLLSAEERGAKHLDTFVRDRLIEKNVDFYNSLKKLKSKTFKDLYKIMVKNNDSNKTVLSNTELLIRHMYSAAKSGRDINLQEILQSELREPPPSLFYNDGQLRSITKAVLAGILHKKSRTLDTLAQEPRMKTGKIIDGQALIQAIGKPKHANTFGDLSNRFVQSVRSQFHDCESVHVLFDQYNNTSIKQGTRAKRSRSVAIIQQQINSPGTILPKKWANFINSNENKVSLNNFISKSLVEAFSCPSENVDRELVTAGGFSDPTEIFTNVSRNVEHLRSNHEEADTRFILHGIDFKNVDFQRIIINSRDTDVLLLLIHFYDQLPPEVWVNSGTSKRPKYHPVHEIVLELSDTMRKTLLAYHAITGCDTTSSFSGLTKNSTWATFTKHCNLLIDFGSSETLNEEGISKSEEFVILLYTSKKSFEKLTNIDDLRSAMFPNIKGLDKLPPTRDALHQHLKRANYQTFIWRTADVTIQKIPPATDSGWIMKNNHLVPVTTLKAPISVKDLDLISCKCKTGCRTSRCCCTSKKQKCIGGVCHPGKQCFNEHNYIDDMDDDD